MALLLVSSVVAAGPGGAALVGVASADHNCGIMDKWITAVTYGESYQEYDIGCDITHGESEFDDGLNQTEFKQSLVNQGQRTVTKGETAVTNYENQMSAIRLEALALGKNAAIRAMENGSTQANAKSAAQERMDDYVSFKIQQLRTDYEFMVFEWAHYNNLSNSEGLGEDVVALQSQGVTGTTTTLKTLPNGTAVEWTDLTSSPAPDTTNRKGWESEYPINALSINIDTSTNQKNVNYDVHPYIWAYQNMTQMADDSVADSAASQVKTFVDEVYASYDQGDIPTEDLIDPYGATLEYAPQSENDTGNYQAWAMTMLSQTEGVNPPENLSQTGYFNVSHGAQISQGMLLSGGVPESGQFSTGKTYDATQIEGSQYLVTENDTVPLTGEFAIQDITASGGESVQNVTYQGKVDWKTNNLSQYHQTMNETRRLLAEIDAREANSGGSGGPVLGGNSSKAIGVVVILGAAVLYMREKDGGDGGRRR